jgi:hypothetical protein
MFTRVYELSHSMEDNKPNRHSQPQVAPTQSRCSNCLTAFEDHCPIDDWECDSICARMSRKADPELVLVEVVRRAYRDYGKDTKFLH